ncbi:hypothetical protein [Planctomicrobium piriforme]|uniref:Uncharacterized protein n=1 Tax=Planctomicrobium piriforme TaxID=1576369 RepID=A0A1I3DF49_9PLAN|nr:hypothetical protein [Planctomicrobium piriforme]SFH85412.1 hypothetical protein SAMN05421753_103215 [Planctomicrobium piriforme]
MLNRTLCLAVALLLGWAVSSSPVSAQDMRVYTTVSELSRAPAPSRAVSHSLTLFHAGKVYDYMEEAGEVLIFEPVHHRFVILGKNFSATEVPFAEINHSLESTRTESVQVVEKLLQQSDDNSRRLGMLMNFQLNPEFQSNLSENRNVFEMKAEPLTYTVKTTKLDSPQFVRQYLDYADWAARLNFVLHPSSNFPDVRLKLNEALRREELLPTQVDLQFETLNLQNGSAPRGKQMQYRAEHQFTWEFQSVDRRHISHWEKQLRSNDIRWMTFQEYQQKLVAQRSK